jgi:hypothetical protein
MEAISLPFATLVIQVLGLPGLIFIIWHFDNKRFESQRQTYETQQNQQREEYKGHVSIILGQYKEDVSEIKHLYESNVSLVKNYEYGVKQWEKLDGELAGIITLNTQILTRLVEKVDGNQFCPTVRAAGPRP